MARITRNSRKARRGPGRPRTDAKGASARDRVVDTAATLFARNGYGQTTTAEIAREAKTSEGTVFHHFPTKRALLAEVGRREGERVLQVGLAGMDPNAAPPDPEIFLRPLFLYARSSPETYRLFAMDGDLEDLASGFSAKREQVIAGLAVLLAGWSARGFLPSMNPEIVAELVFAVTDGAVRRLVLEERWDEQEEWIQRTCHAVRALIAPRRDASQPLDLAHKEKR